MSLLTLNSPYNYQNTRITHECASTVNVELPRRETNSASTSKAKTGPSFNHMEHNHPMGKSIRS
jgi:hypothetical protein